MIPSSSKGRLSRSTLIALINKASTFSHLTQTHAQLILNGYHYDITTITKLTQKLFDFGSTRHACALVFSVPKPDIFLFNVLVRGFSLNASPSSSISLYTHLRRNTNLAPNNFTYASTIPACSDDKHLMLLHAHSIIDGYGSHIFVGSALVKLYSKFSRVGFARKVFDGMPERDTVLWNSMISGLVNNCCYDESVQVFRDMIAQGVRLDSSTVNAVLSAFAELQELRVGMGIQCLALKIGFNSCVYVLTGLISLYAKCGDVNTARMLFGLISKPDLIAYNAMISGFTFNGWCGEIRDVIFSDNGTVTVVYRLTVRGSDGEAYRESTGTVSTIDGSISDPDSAAEENVFCKVCARFGLGLYLYHDDQTTSM
ncbi:hypothetical protein TSUD_232820 [Trifolium subterraneum]|uniref:Pentatricopeptide repeat-containing protein n=1 Tax=Trifolium subterraneum TaxID=3900 RepID=A0A2Z6MMU9_TRISU|nr:hypothetical protein TSUD_232820 [Trifolium subterraneum]